MKLHRVYVARIVFVACVVAFCLVCSAQSADAPKPSTFVFTKDMTVYVSDFELQAQNVQTDPGAAAGRTRPGILERPEKRQQQDPEAQAKMLVNTLSTTIVSDMQKAGYKAQRLAAGDPKPAKGVWVHGIFTEADEGNRLHRAVIGFGSGQAKMDLFVTMSDLANPEKPLYESAVNSQSKDKMGAAISMNPYVAAAKFVMEKNASEKTVKSAASDISKQIVVHLKEHEGSQTGQ